MPPRAAKYADLLPAARVLARAFENSDMLGIWLHPNRKQYPDDMSLFFLQWLRAHYFESSDHHIVVTYKGNTEECITGVAIWTRKRAERRQPSYYNRLLCQVVGAYNSVESYFWPNRAVEPTRLDQIMQAGSSTEHYFTGSRADDWHLGLIGVDPRHEKQGYGRELVKFGFDEAKREGVGCSVITAEKRFPFYRSCGFSSQPENVDGETGDLPPGVNSRFILFAEGT